MYRIIHRCLPKDTHFRQYKLCILSLAGDLIATFTPDPDPGFGVRNVAWHPNGLFLLVAGWDDKVGILMILSCLSIPDNWIRFTSWTV